MSETPEESVALSIPAATEWLALVRTTGAAVASHWGLTYDEIADLRLAIDELCLTLVEGVLADHLDITYSLNQDHLEVVGVTRGARFGSVAQAGEDGNTAASQLTSSELSARILDALVDEHDCTDLAGERRAWLRKRRSSKPA